MTSTDPSSTGLNASSRRRAALTGAAEDLEALTEAYDECSHALEAAEGTVDAILDDPDIRDLVLDADRRVVAMSRGMAAAIGRRDAVLERAIDEVAPAGWPPLDPALDGLSVDEGWRSVPLADDSGRLCLRRVSGDETGAAIVVRYEPREPGAAGDPPPAG